MFRAVKVISSESNQYILSIQNCRKKMPNQKMTNVNGTVYQNHLVQSDISLHNIVCLAEIFS